jgi:hypothetical protein
MANKPRSGDEQPSSTSDDLSIDRPRLTPQGRTDEKASGTDATDPGGSGAKQGQSDKAEG